MSHLTVDSNAGPSGSQPPTARLIASGLEFPEGPIAMQDGSVLLVEIRGQRLTRVWPDGTKETVADVPGGPNGAAIGPDGKCYICNNGGFRWAEVNGVLKPHGPAEDYQGGSLQRVDLQTGAIETVAERCGETILKGPNDLVFDASGGLWFSDLGKRRARDLDLGSVYYLKPGGSEVVEVIRGMMPVNGVGLSPNQDVLYVAETPTARLWSFELAAPGVIKPGASIFGTEVGRPLAGLGGYRMFDSLAIEECGNICVATLIDGCISVFAPDGQLLDNIATADPMTTNIAFGGPDLRTAFITLSGRGELVAMDWQRAGLKLSF